MKSAVLGISCMFLFVAAAAADDDLARDSDNLKQLLGEIQKALPEGWHAALTADVPEKVVCEFRQPEAYGIMIWNQYKAIGKYVGLNLAPGSMDAEEQPQRLFFQMSLMGFLTPEQYRAAAEKNVEHDRARHEFQGKLGEAGIKNSQAFKVKASDEPQRPTTFKPETAEQKELVTRYALVWAETEPQTLPTHFYKNMAFNVDFDEHFVLQDDQLEAERRELRQAILKLVTAYGKEATAKDSQ